MPQHKDLNIWIETDSGVQHWQHAALGFSIISGITTGVFAFALLFHTVRVPISDAGLGLVLSARDAKTPLAHEIQGYFANEAGDHVTIPPRKSFKLVKEGGLTVYEPEKTVLITSLFPRSYISAQNSIIPTRFTQNGIELQHGAHRFTPTPSTAGEFINTTPTADVFSIPDLQFSKWELLPDKKGVALAGEGSETSFIRFISELNRPLTTNTLTLEDGTTVKEMRAPSQKVGISSASDITTYANSNPYLLATYNKQQASWTLRTAPSGAITDSQSSTLADTCPLGTHSELSDFANDQFSIGKFVMSIADKLSDNKQSTYLCIPVDKL